MKATIQHRDRAMTERARIGEDCYCAPTGAGRAARGDDGAAKRSCLGSSVELSLQPTKLPTNLGSFVELSLQPTKLPTNLGSSVELSLQPTKLPTKRR